jgi:GNAT superfamily N-acetyltransferase
MSPAAIIITVVAAIMAATVVLIVRGVVSAQKAADEAARLAEEARRMKFQGLDIRPLGAGDKAVWEKLWYAYCDFYDEAVSQPTTDALWGRIHDAQFPIRGYGAYDGERLLGIAHIILHPHTWSTKTVCYLEDLFVDQTVRGRNVGHTLIDFLWKTSETEGWGRLYWHTDSNNARARRLYDRFKPADAVVRYTIDIGAPAPVKRDL